MASTYTPLGVELMVTGENAGTWGTKTNTNLNILEQIIGGYSTKSIAGGAQTTDLTVVDGNTTGTAQFRMIEFTGTITGNQIVTIPNDVETFYFLRNSTSGANTVQFKYATGSGSTTTFSATDKGDKLVIATANDGTNPDIKEVSLASPPGGSNTQIQFNNSGSFGGSANLVWDGSNLNIGAQGDLRLQDSTGGEYIAQQAAATTTSYTLTWPAGVAAGNGYVLKSTTGGVLSWEEASAGGTSWQAVVTSATKAAVAGEGYFLNTTSNAITLTLPSSPSIGDEVSFVDYAGTFDTNNLTIARNSQKINGATSDLTVATERAANTLVFTDATQGWLLKNN
jgi:hypothetical protein